MVLTRKNKEVFDFVLAYQREHPQGMPPSLREISRACGLGDGPGGSAAAAQYHMLKLVDLGMAEITNDKARRYRVIDMHAELVMLQRAARNYLPERVFGPDALKDWARRADYVSTTGQGNVAP